MLDDDLARHAHALRHVAGAPLRAGTVTLLPEAMTALRAMFEAIAGARHTILLEYYTFEDVIIDGRSLSDLLHDRLAARVRVAIIYDAIGSDDTPDRVFDALRAAGAGIVEFHGLNPLRRFFSLDINDRDHRKILLVDDRIAFLGGVNMDRQYLNPPAAGIPPDRDMTRAFWQDAAARFEGPCVEDLHAVFTDTWRRQHGGPIPPAAPADPSPPDPRPDAAEQVCIEGSAPREGRPLHTRALLAAINQARRSIMLATGYFVPMPDEILALRRAARRGVDIRLVLPGVSDVPGAVHAGRAAYGRMLRVGVAIHELRDAVLHAKVATIDGVWSSIGSSNFDRRSAVLNNEVDAVILGRRTAGSIERMLLDWSQSAHPVTLRAWNDRSLRERIDELSALTWKRLM